MKQILATFPLRNFLRVFALVTAVSATSCSKDPAVDGELHGDMLRFAVAEADGWNTQLRCGAAGSEEKSAASPENVAEAVRRVGPWGIDVSGGVESSPGIKSKEKLLKFIKEAKQ